LVGWLVGALAVGACSDKLLAVPLGDAVRKTTTTQVSVVEERLQVKTLSTLGAALFGKRRTQTVPGVKLCKDSTRRGAALCLNVIVLSVCGG